MFDEVIKYLIDHLEISIEQVTDIRSPDDRYFRNRARGIRAPYFRLSLTTPPLEYAEHMEVSAQIESFEGAFEVFTFANPLPALASFANQNVNASFAKGVKSVVIAGSHAFRVGDFIKFSNHAKVYRISSVTPGTNTTIGLSCPLIESISAVTDLIYGANVNFQVCLSNNYSQEVSGKNGNFGMVDVELIEQA